MNFLKGFRKHRRMKKVEKKRMFVSEEEEERLIKDYIDRI